MRSGSIGTKCFITAKRALVDLYGITPATVLPAMHGNARGWRGLRLRRDPATGAADVEY